MSYKFSDWYSQALGATLGMIACVYAYLNGYMFVYGNIGRNFDYLRFEGVMASYLLYPLCILTLILALIKSYIQRKDIFNISFEGVNIVVVILTVAVGFMGAKIYFTIPALFIVFSYIKTYIIKSNYKKTTQLEESNVNIQNNEDISNIIDDSQSTKENINLLLTKREMAMDLLKKNASSQFISEITGLTLEEINNLGYEKNELC